MVEPTTTLAYLSPAQLYGELRRRNLPVPSFGAPAMLADAMVPTADKSLSIIQSGKGWEELTATIMIRALDHALETSDASEWDCVIYAYDVNGGIDANGADAVVCYRGGVVRIVNDRTIIFATGESVHVDSVIAMSI